MEGLLLILKNQDYLYLVFLGNRDSGTSCTDSDSGQNLLVAGQTSDGKTTNQDYCIDADGNPVGSGKTVVEYYCDKDGRLNSNKLDCPLGTGCLNGKCVTNKLRSPELTAVGGIGSIETTITP